MREVYKSLPRWNYREEERALWELDQRINDRGVCVDLALANAAIRECAEAQANYAIETLERTNGSVTSTNRRDKLLEHILEEYGILLADMTRSEIEKRVDDPNLPLALREVLGIRLQSSKTSVSKYKRVVNGVSKDGRLRGLLQFCGAARTGRWSGRLFQPQNLPRPTMGNDDIERGIELLKTNSWGLI